MEKEDEPAIASHSRLGNELEIAAFPNMRSTSCDTNQLVAALRLASLIFLIQRRSFDKGRILTLNFKQAETIFNVSV